MTTVSPPVRFIAPLAALVLSGCGVVELIASGASDGTKYVIRRMDEPNAAAGAANDAPPPPSTPVAPPEADPPEASAAPVIPVTRGEPLD